MTTIYIMDISKLNQDEVFERYFARVSLWRRQKIERAKFRMDKNRSLGAAILLAHGLLPYGISERDALICRGKYGKPYISAVLKDGRGEEVRGIHFNLSHSGTYVAAAFGDVRVGIDIEHIRENWKKIAEHFFSEEEVRNIMACQSEAERRDLFLRYWTIKESAMKVSGAGMRIPLRDIFLKENGKVLLKTGNHFSEYFLKEFEIVSENDIIADGIKSDRGEGGYRISVCAETDAFAQEMIWVE